MHNKVFRISIDDLEDYGELLAQHPELLAGCQRWLARVPELDPLIVQIEQAFAGETLGNGTGLLEAQGIDDYAGEAELQALRKRDEQTDWRRIDVELLNQCYSSPTFFDARGFVFHLPAFLIAQLNDQYGHSFIDNLICALESTPPWLTLLTPAQREAIAATLRLVSEHPEYDEKSEAIQAAMERLTSVNS